MQENTHQNLDIEIVRTFLADLIANNNEKRIQIPGAAMGAGLKFISSDYSLNDEWKIGDGVETVFKKLH